MSSSQIVDGSIAFRELMLVGLEDWFDVGWVLSAVNEGPHAGRQAALESACGVIARLLLGGLAEAGWVRAEFEPWELGSSDALCRICRELLSVGDGEVLPGDIAWFALTDAGRELATFIVEGSGGFELS